MIWLHLFRGGAVNPYVISIGYAGLHGSALASGESKYNTKILFNNSIVMDIVICGDLP
jgi:hypothetical protein